MHDRILLFASCGDRRTVERHQLALLVPTSQKAISSSCLCDSAAKRLTAPNIRTAKDDDGGRKGAIAAPGHYHPTGILQDCLRSFVSGVAREDQLNGRSNLCSTRMRARGARDART